MRPQHPAQVLQVHFEPCVGLEYLTYEGDSYNHGVMHYLLAGLIIAGLVPLGLAVRANWATSLLHALVWGVVAQLSWGVAILVSDPEATAMAPGRFCALALTGCAGVAVLGARRPHVFAWNFVVLGLFAVMVLPLVETLFLGTHPIDPLRIFFLSATLAVSILNYLPTRFGPAALLLLGASAGQITLLYAPELLQETRATWLFDGLIALVPWIAWLCAMRRSDRSEFDTLWRTFRDRWGLLWGQRLREQFNHAARNAGWPVKLYWQGLVRDENAAISDVEREKMVATLRAALQRFLATDD